MLLLVLPTAKYSTPCMLHAWSSDMILSSVDHTTPASQANHLYHSGCGVSQTLGSVLRGASPLTLRTTDLGAVFGLLVGLVSTHELLLGYRVSS